MFPYKKFLIKENDRFDPIDYPRLVTTVEEIRAELATETLAPKADMLLSYVKHHSIATQLVNDHPTLSTLIISKSLPLNEMEDLFDSAKGNQAFTNGLETYIKTCVES